MSTSSKASKASKPTVIWKGAYLGGNLHLLLSAEATEVAYVFSAADAKVEGIVHLKPSNYATPALLIEAVSLYDKGSGIHLNGKGTDHFHHRRNDLGKPRRGIHAGDGHRSAARRFS